MKDHTYVVAKGLIFRKRQSDSFQLTPFYCGIFFKIVFGQISTVLREGQQVSLVGLEVRIS